MCVAGAIVGGAVIGGGASIIAGDKAADAQRDAAKDASATELQMYNQNREDLAPYREGGYQALNELLIGLGLQPETGGGGQSQPLSYEQWSMQNRGTATGPGPGGGAGSWNDLIRSGMGDTMSRAAYQNYVKNFKPTAPTNVTQRGYFNKPFTMDQFTMDPGYQFRLNEGTKALQASAAADSGLYSGATLKALQRYGQDYASGEFQNSYNRFNADRDRRFNRLASLAGVGQTATNTTAQLGSESAGRVADYQTQAGNAASARAVNTGSAINDTIGSIGQFYLQKQYMKNQGNPGVYV